MEKIAKLQKIENYRIMLLRKRFNVMYSSEKFDIFFKGKY